MFSCVFFSNSNLIKLYLSQAKFLDKPDLVHRDDLEKVFGASE